MGLTLWYLLPGIRKGPRQGWPSHAGGQELGKSPIRARSLIPAVAKHWKKAPIGLALTHMLPGKRKGPHWG